MNFCYYSTPFSSHGKCISVFGTSSPSFLGSVKIKSITWLVFFPMYSVGNYHSSTASPLHKTSGKKFLFLTICGILNMFFILGFILFKCYFYASSLSWMFCSAHSLPPFLSLFNAMLKNICLWTRQSYSNSISKSAVLLRTKLKGLFSHAWGFGITGKNCC